MSIRSFTAFITGMNAHFAEWRATNAATLKTLKAGCHPKLVIAELAEDLLARYTHKPLISPYDIYQHLMDYWAATMQDDCYLIAAGGWKAETSRIIEATKSKHGKLSKQIDKGWTCDLVPKALLIARYYADEQAAIDKLTVDLENVTAKLAELEEEQLGDEDAFSEARTETAERHLTVTHLRQLMLDELQRRNYSQSTASSYIFAVEDFAKYFHRSPERLGREHIRQHQAYLFRERKLSHGTIEGRTAALRFLFIKTLRRPYLPDHIPFPLA
jgi:hypothetical protein